MKKAVIAIIILSMLAAALPGCQQDGGRMETAPAETRYQDDGQNLQEGGYQGGGAGSQGGGFEAGGAQGSGLGGGF